MSAARPHRPRAGGFFFSSRRRHTMSLRDWSSDVCSSDLMLSFRASAASRGIATILIEGHLAVHRPSPPTAPKEQLRGHGGLRGHGTAETPYRDRKSVV